MFDGELSDLVIDEVTSLDETHFRILESVGAPASREAVCRVAANVAEEAGDFTRAGLLLIDAGDAKRGLEFLERATWRDSASIIAALRPLQTLTPKLADTLATALIDQGRYRDAREITSNESLLARIERRTGDYKPALVRLERLPRCGSNDALRAEILIDRKSTRLNSSHIPLSRMPSS